MTTQLSAIREPENTLYGLLTSRAQTLRDLPFIECEGTTWSYAETLRRAEIAASSFIGLGCQPDSRIAMMVENRIEFIAAWFGTALAGAVHVPINLEYKGDILIHVLRDIDAEVMVCEDYLLDHVLDAAASAESKLKTIVVLGEIPDTTPVGEIKLVGWDAFIEAGTHVPPATYHHRPAGALGAILLTSGTTGVSKGVMVSDKHCIFHGREAAEAYGMTSADVMYTCLPLFHANAAWATVLSAMTVGAKAVVAKRFSASRFWDQIRAAGATQVSFLGTVLHILMAQPKSDADRDHQVRIGTSVPCPVDIMVAFERRFGFPLLETFGTTETKRILSNRHYLRRIGSAGLPTPSSEVAIHDDEGWSLPPGQIGELAFRPKEPGILMLGYLNRPDATLASLRDGWWHTGDLAWQDSDGFVYFAGRKKDALRRRGENVSAFEVERALLMHDDVLHAAVVAAPSDLSEDEILAVIVLKPGAETKEDAIFLHANSRLPSFMVPRFITFVPDLPHTPTGKIAKQGLADTVMSTAVWDCQRAGLSATKAAGPTSR